MLSQGNNSAKNGRPIQHRAEGAALIIVIAIMTILLAIALTFFSVSRVEVNTATNVSNSVRVDLLLDAASAIAIATLNQDFLNHPEATSTDHAWRTLFNGAWAVGKPFARAGALQLSENVIDGTRQPGLPEIDLNRIQAALGPDVIVSFPDGHTEPLFQGTRSRQWLYIPRYQGPVDQNGPSTIVLYDDVEILEGNVLLTPAQINPRLAPLGLRMAKYRATDPIWSTASVDEATVPFVTSALYGRVVYGADPNNRLNPSATFDADIPRPIHAGPAPDDRLYYPAEQIHAWADIDNDGDGLRDSIWIPLPGDLYFPDDGIDNNLNGWYDEQQDDNIDNDGLPNTFTGQSNEINPYADNRTQQVRGIRPVFETVTDPDEAIEPGIFVYDGSNDGLDNDGNGLVDADDPNEILDLSNPNAPRGLFLTAPLPGLTFNVDLNADGLANDLVVDAADGVLKPLRVTLPDRIRVVTSSGVVFLSNANVDRLDNDLDLLVNEYFGYVYVGPNPLGIGNNLAETFAPPFVTTFNANGSLISSTSNTVFNSHLGNPLFELPGVFPNNWYDSWRSVGNWVEEFALQPPALPGLKSDAELFSVARSRAYTEINSSCFDLDGNGVPDFNFFPQEIVRFLPDELPTVGRPNINMNLLARYIRVTHSGEPVCELVGRAAILINDEASKINLNVAGATTPNDEYPLFRNPVTGEVAAGGAQNYGPRVPATYGQGTTPGEYDLRYLPQVGINTLGRIAAARTGTPPARAGNATQFDELPLGLAAHIFDNGISANPNRDYSLDVSFPGYARTDDNGNALYLATNGIDDDGDGLIDEGFYLPPVSAEAAPFIFGPGDYSNLDANDPIEAPILREINLFREYWNRLGNLEGIDEPGELQSFTPLRNLIAERDFIDNSANGIQDEAGEFGDFLFADFSPDQLVDRLTSPDDTTIFKNTLSSTLRELSPFLTTFSTDRNTTFVKAENGAIRARNQLDFTTASAKQIAATLMFTGDFTPITEALDANGNTLVGKGATNFFAEGLRQNGQGVRAPYLGAGALPAEDYNAGLLYTVDGANLIPTTSGPQHAIPADPQLTALQIAANIADNRDADHARTTLTTEYADTYLAPGERSQFANWPTEGALSSRELTNPNHLLPLEQLERDLVSIYDIKDKRLESTDLWWAAYVVGDCFPADISCSIPEKRAISYTVAGTDSIRINELMPRPVRRIEAETYDFDAILGPGAISTFDPISEFAGPLENLDPSPEKGFFDTSAGTYIPVMPRFAVERKRLRQRMEVEYNFFNLLTSDPATPTEQWILEGEYIGEDATIRLGTNDLLRANQGAANFGFQDVVEFIIAASPSDEALFAPGGNALPPQGLPAGRYYLTLNSQLGGEATVTDQDDIVYSIKYVQIDPITGQLEGGSSSIVDDFKTAIDSELTDVWNTDFFKQHFAQLQPSFIPDRRGQPQGWVFLDGTPIAANGRNTDLAPATPEYFATTLLQRTPTTDFAPTGLDTPSDVSVADNMHTILIPPRESGWGICIAVSRPNPAIANVQPNGIAINFFDFSQQPDHEYIELANISEDAIDLTGYTLEVGIPDADRALNVRDVPVDSLKSIWRVPDGTTIAPGGMLLLGFNKYDRYANLALSDPTTINLLDVNGIGLARGSGVDFPLLDGLQQVTVPPIFDISNIAEANPAYNNGGGDMFAKGGPFGDRSGSVFERNAAIGELLYDYIDRDGDGVSATNLFDLLADHQARFIDKLTDNSLIENNLQSTPDPLLAIAGVTGPNKPWDRIVQLECIQLRRQNPDDPTSAVLTTANLTLDSAGLDLLADLVLQGGILPDYPERDRADNDGDGGFLTTRVAVVGCPDPAVEYTPGTLDKDMVDNNLNGYIDEQGIGVDINEDAIVNGCAGEPTYQLQYSEGVDEGNLGLLAGRRYGPGSYERGTLPVLFFNDRRTGVYPTKANFLEFDLDNGDTADAGMRYLDQPLFQPDNTISPANAYKAINATPGSQAEADRKIWYFGLGATPYAPNVSVETPYLGSDLDPPDWKAFAERRWNPGDNVIVSLYDAKRDLVDRVTYIESDVTNRTIDDIIPCPYRDAAGNSVGLYPRLATITGPDDTGYPSFWLPNQMGLDFYRALERKDPLYHGDRFGTTNRWQPTDGNYDDWAESPSFWKAGHDFSPDLGADFGQPYRSSIQPRLRNINDAVGAADDARIYRHAFYGSPLRMNLATRIERNPIDIPRLLAETLPDPYDFAALNLPIVSALNRFDGRPDHQDARPLAQFYTARELTRYDNNPFGFTEILPNTDWHFTKVTAFGQGVIATSRVGILDQVRIATGELIPQTTRPMNTPYRNPADLLGVPLITFTHDSFNTAYGLFTATGGEGGFLLDNNGININDESNNDLRANTARRGVTIGLNLDIRDTVLSQVAAIAGQDSIVLTASQADFTPIAPNSFEINRFPNDHPLPNGQDYASLLNFISGGATTQPPHAWSPIFLYELPGDTDTTGPTTRFPYYPPYPSGSVSNALIDIGQGGPFTLPFLLNTPRLFPDGANNPSYFSASPRAGAPINYALTPNQLADRAPLENRVLLYLASHRDTPGNTQGFTRMADEDKAEALFAWDAQDGLENGEYIIHIDTYIRGLAQRLRALRTPGDVSASSVPDLHKPDDPLVPVNLAEPNLPSNPSQAVIQALIDWEENIGKPGYRFDSIFNIEFITDRTKARGVADTSFTGGDTSALPGLLPPAAWNPGIYYTADTDGRIFYGDQSSGAWNPLIVRVTDNFLAMRIRFTWEPTGTGADGYDKFRVAAFSKITLSPRKRTPGRINLNTTTFAETHQGGAQRRLFSVLMGLPGIGNATGPLAPNASISAPSNNLTWNSGNSWAPPATFIGGAEVPPTPFGPQDGNNDTYLPPGAASPEEAAQLAATQLSALLIAGRTIHPDGRYYKSPTDLITEANSFTYDPTHGRVLPWDGDPATPRLQPLSNKYTRRGNTIFGTLDLDEARFNEVAERFRRLSKSLTLRSDVFEIIATVESGYGLDANGDGKLNYRSPDEFVTTGATKARLVYERRAPSDRSDEAGVQ